MEERLVLLVETEIAFMVRLKISHGVVHYLFG